jgi:hypothetical protein
MASFTRFSLIVAAAVVPLACREGYIIIDHWGPPAGYAAVEGTIRFASGAPAPNTRVNITRCTSPIGGFFGEDVSDQEGGYRVNGRLSPSPLPRSTLDSLLVRCDVLVGERGAAAVVDTVTVRFAVSPDSVVPIVRDLTLP